MVRKVSIAIVVVLLLMVSPMVTHAAEPYEGSISSSYLDYARDLLPKVGLEEDYVFYRSGQYDYMFVHGDIDCSGGRFSGDVHYHEFNTGSGYNSSPTMVSDSMNGWSLDTQNRIVYSSLGDFPTIEERGAQHETIQTILIVIIALCVFIRGLFFRR